MTIEREEQLEKLKRAGKVVAETMAAMAKAMEPGMTTRELDKLGRALLEREGARPAPESTANMNTKTTGHLGLTDAEEDALVSFMQTLTDGYTPDGLK